MLREKNSIVPVLRINNRHVNQLFLEKNLGLKTILEEGAFAEFAGHTGAKEAQIVLVESPSMRTRAVKGTKKLQKIIMKVQNPAEIEALLAAGSVFAKLYQGEKGFAFESLSPEGDCFLLHAEDTLTALKEIVPPASYEGGSDLVGLTDFAVEAIVINTPHPQQSQAFYQTVLPESDVLRFQEAKGEDLLAAADTTWDLDSLRVAVVSSFDWQQLEEKLTKDYFKDKKETFLQTTDPSNIEVWFEK